MYPPFEIKNPAALRRLYGIRFKHFHDAPTGAIVATVATYPLIGGQVRVAVAYVAPADRHSATRDIGRRIALARLHNDHAIEMDAADFRAAVADRSLLSRLHQAGEVVHDHPAHTLRPRRQTPSIFARQRK